MKPLRNDHLCKCKNPTASVWYLELTLVLRVSQQPTPQNRTSSQRTGCSSTTHTSALKVSPSEAPSPPTWRRGRPDAAGGGGRTSEKNFTDTGSGHGAPLVLKAAPLACRWNLTLIQSYLGLQSCTRAAGALKLRSITALPRLFVSSVPYLAIALKPGH